jgi:hypothetical protein
MSALKSTVKGWKARIRSRALMEALLPTVDPETAAYWVELMAGWDGRDDAAEAAARVREVTYTDAGITDAHEAQGKPTARVRKKKKGIGPAQLAFWLSVRECVGKRRRGEPGYGTSPATRFTP